MTAPADVTWEGLTAMELERRCGVPRVHVLAETTSTQDVAHELAEQGSPAGTTVVSDSQVAGRGRHGRSWNSEPEGGVWCTILERPSEPQGIALMSLRVGLALAAALDAFATGRIRVKWPNDLITEAGKIAGILIEARWSGNAVAWIAVGVGVNMVAPKTVSGAAALRSGVSRVDVLAAVVGAVRSAVAIRSPQLDDVELADFHERDGIRGRRIVEPALGVVAGINSAGHLLVDTKAGREEHRDGGIVLAEDS